MRAVLHIYHAHAARIAEAFAASGRTIVAWSTPAELRRGIGDVEALVAEDPPRDVWPLATKLRLLHALGAGVDDLLPAPGLAPDVVVCNARGVFAAEAAEHALAMMLALERNVPAMVRRQDAREWRPFHVGKLEGRTVGILGLGAIGARIARMCGALGMRVLGASRSGRPVDGVEVRALDALLPESEHLVVCAPKTPETLGLLDARALAALPVGAFVTALGRGGIVDEAALLAALDDGHLGGAALDVFVEEPLPREHPLWAAPNTIITPHVAGYGRRYLERVAEVVLENLDRLDAGRPLLHTVDRARGY